MKKILFPVVALALVLSALAAMSKMDRERRAAKAESAVLAERLTRTDAVAATVLEIDKKYREAMDENASLKGQLAAAEASLRRAELKDAVADRPKPKRAKKPRSALVQPLPGYNEY